MGMKNIEDFYPLSPMQQGMLFHSLYEPHSGVYVEQLSSTLRGKLNVEAFKQAWQQVMRRHPVLRTAFMWEGLDEPIQVVHRQVDLLLEQQDWREVPETEVAAKQQRYLVEERRRGFDLSRPPLIRLGLMRTAEDAHFFAMTYYHAIFDGWSLPIILKEVFTFYEAIAQNKTVKLPPARPYRDYIAWFKKQDFTRAEKFWRETLKGFTAPTPLVVDRPAEAVSGKESKSELDTGYDLGQLQIPTETLTALQSLTRKHRLTLNTLVQGAWALLLSRYSGENDIVYGTTVSGRPADLPGAESMVGLFINTLPVRVRIEENISLLEWLRRLQEHLVELRQYESSPLVQIQGWSEVPRGTPLFESILVFENYPLDSSLWKGSLQIENARAIEQTNYPITLAGIPEKDSWWLKILYDNKRFEKDTIERLLAHLLTILQSVVTDPTQPIKNVTILTEQEKKQLLDEWNQTDLDYPEDLCVHQLFETRVEKTPHHIAVTFDGIELTYQELNRRANQLAHYLRRQGVGPDTLVGICVDRSLEMVVGLLGILKAGGAYLPLDPTYPSQRLAYMLADSGAAVILAQEHLLEKLPKTEARFVLLDRDWPQIALESGENPTLNVVPDNLAYVIYTSGSTGRPKGTLLQHRGLRNLVHSQIEGFGVSENSRVLQFASFSFDASVSETFMALLKGATLCLAKQEELMSGPELVQLLEREAITTVTLPPSLLAVLPDEPLPALETIISAGEKCSWDIISRWAPGRRFINAYGPTEATIGPTLGRVEKVEEGLLNVPIGRPIYNIQVYLLDERMEPVPIGVPGEIYLGGVGLARGYLNQPALTAEKFLPDPFGKKPGARLYRTGDLARFLPDGRIEFLGRVDSQIKMRGYRIELGELEAVLKEHPEVKDAVVIQREDVPGNTRLVAYIVPKEKNQLELWPSVAEFFIYDDLLYFAMTNDQRRNQSYKVAMEKLVKDKVVVDIGTGKDAILSRMCIEAGAKKVYAIEILKESYEKARQTIRKLGLEDRIILIHGDSRKVELPEKVDVCVSEIVGPIGGSEGAGVILNDARRFLKEDGVMIPERSLTTFAAVTLPDEFFENPGFTEMTKHYAEQIFEQVGYKFDFRLSLKGLSKKNLISNVEVFEDLDFSGMAQPEYQHDVRFEITRDARLDGFLVWLNLHTIKGEVIDILEHEYSWLPVYFPVFYPGIQVAKGDIIEATVTATLCENKLNPDYNIKGKLIKQTGEEIEFDYTSYHFKKVYKATPFYELLFENDSIRVRKDGKGGLSSRILKEHIQKYLPEYMVPSVFVILDSFPLTPNGKVDRKALPAPEGTRPELQVTYVPPRTPVEEELAKLWAEVLGVERVGIHDNFFDLGGHSLLATQIFSRLREMYNVDLSLRNFFEAPTIVSLAKAIAEQQAKNKDARELEKMLAEIEGLSDEEVQKLIAGDTDGNK